MLDKSPLNMFTSCLTSPLRHLNVLSHTPVIANSPVTTKHVLLPQGWNSSLKEIYTEMSCILSHHYLTILRVLAPNVWQVCWTGIIQIFKWFVVFKKGKACNALKLEWNVGQMRSLRKRSESYAIWLCHDKTMEMIQTSCYILLKPSPLSCPHTQHIKHNRPLSPKC